MTVSPSREREERKPRNRNMGTRIFLMVKEMGNFRCFPSFWRPNLVYSSVAVGERRRLRISVSQNHTAEGKHGQITAGDVTS